MKPTPYQLEKLATMNRENTAEVWALKAAAAGEQGNSVVGRAQIAARAHKLERAIKAAARLERDLGLHKKPGGAA